MFTGIIQGTGKIEKIEGNRFVFGDYEITRSRDDEYPPVSRPLSGGRKKRIAHYNITHYNMLTESPLQIGESIAVSGVCLTVLEAKKEFFTVEIMAESRDRTTFAHACVGDIVNLERAAIIGSRNSGHFVTGHIDEVGKILSLRRDRDFWRVRISFSPRNSLFLVEKGSISVDGISLTIAALGADWFEVGIISHTWDITNLSQKKVGDGVNLEFDILGKYVVKTSMINEQ